MDGCLSHTGDLDGALRSLLSPSHLFRLCASCYTPLPRSGGGVIQQDPGQGGVPGWDWVAGTAGPLLQSIHCSGGSQVAQGCSLVTTGNHVRKCRLRSISLEGQRSRKRAAALQVHPEHTQSTMGAEFSLHCRKLTVKAPQEKLTQMCLSERECGALSGPTTTLKPGSSSNARWEVVTSSQALV